MKSLIELMDNPEARPTLWLPVDLTEKDSYMATALARLQDYKRLINDKAADPQKDGELLDRINRLISGLIGIIEIISDDFDGAKRLLRKTLETTGFNQEYIMKYFCYQLPESETLYRLRNGTHIEKIKMFHCPDVTCGVERFNRAGRPILYCGQSLVGCKKEVSYDPNEYTTAEFTTKTEFKFFDLACVKLNEYKYSGYYGQQDDDYKEAKNELLYLWPIIALSYIVDKTDKEQTKSPEKNTTYLFPQLLSEYIQETYPDIQGIRYFTVRNENIDPVKSTFTDFEFLKTVTNTKTVMT